MIKGVSVETPFLFPGGGFFLGTALNTVLQYSQGMISPGSAS